MSHWRVASSPDGEDSVEGDDDDRVDMSSVDVQVGDCGTDNHVVAALVKAKMTAPTRQRNPLMVDEYALVGALDMLSHRKANVVDPDAYVPCAALLSRACIERTSFRVRLQEDRFGCGCVHCRGTTNAGCRPCFGGM